MRARTGETANRSTSSLRAATVVGSAPRPEPISMSYDLPARVTGMAIDAATVVTNLEAVGCTVHRSDVTLTATPPPWRPEYISKRASTS